MTCPQIHTDEESEDEVLSLVVKETEVDLQEKSEYEILSLIVQEVEAEPQSLQELFKASQQEEEPKARGHRGMTSQRIHKNEGGKRTYSENTIIKHRHQKDGEGKQKLIRLLDFGPQNTTTEAKPQSLQEPFESLQQGEKF